MKWGHLGNIKTENPSYLTLSSIGSINANPQETHFIKTSASSSVTAFGLVVAEPVKVTWIPTMYSMERVAEKRNCISLEIEVNRFNI